MGNQGIHQMDVARWFLGVSALSPRVMSVGGRLGYDDDGETPNTQVVYHDYEAAPLIFETRGLPSGKEYQSDAKAWNSHMDAMTYPGSRPIGVVVECEGGYVVVGDGVAAYDPSKSKIRDFKGEHGMGHMENFITAVRERKPELLTADCLETHLSSGLCHTGLISHRLGKTMSSGEILERIKSEPFAAERFESMKEHLNRNGVDLSSGQVTLGPWLTFDPKKERFVDNDAANAMVKPEYRKPYVVPEKV